MILKKYLVRSILGLILISYASAGKNSDESNKPDVARLGKTRKAKMGKNVVPFRNKHLFRYSRILSVFEFVN